MTRFVASDVRRSQSVFGFRGWSFRATRDGHEVRLDVGEGVWSSGAEYFVWAGDCESVTPPDETLITSVATFPNTPTDDVTAEDEEALREVVASALVRGTPAIDHELVHGLGTDRDCFIASFSTDTASSKDNDRVPRTSWQWSWTTTGRPSADGLYVGTGSRSDWVIETTRCYGRGAIVRLHPPDCLGQLTVTAG